MEFHESDWKLFRMRLPEWQERFMEKLTREYIALLSSDAPASERFWALEKRLREDRQKTGVIARDMSRSNMLTLLLNLCSEGAVEPDELRDFSEDIQSAVDFFTSH